MREQSMVEEGKAAHPVKKQRHPVRKQRQINASVSLNFFFLFSLESFLIE